MQDSTSTPLRGGDVDFPRIRLTDKYSKLIQVPIYALSSNRGMGGLAASLQDRIATSRPEHWPLYLFHRRKYFVADRFIPRRRHQNFEAMNYNLTRVSPPPKNPTERLDVFDQLASLDTTWRKKLIKNAIDRGDVIPGFRDRRVLNFAERDNRRPTVNVTAQERWPEGLRKSKARNRPLIEHSAFTIKLRRSRENFVEVLDWGSQNFIATVIGMSTVIFDGAINNGRIITSPGQQLDVLRDPIIAVKWNNAGNRIAIVTSFSGLQVYSLEKLCWSQRCPCSRKMLSDSCEIWSVTWTHTDREIVGCCDRGRISSYTSSGELIQELFLDGVPMYAAKFSPNDRYLAIATFYNLLVFTWPSLTPHLEIGPIADSSDNVVPSVPMAWNPWEPNILCVGCCPGDNILSLWDIHRQKLLGCTKVVSTSTIEEVTWNKLSGEMVVRLNYWCEEEMTSLVAVLAGLDRVVDFVTNKDLSFHLAWNPDHTLLAVRKKRQIKVWNFFGSEIKNWYDPEEDERKRKKMNSLKRRRAIYTDQTIHFEQYSIR